VVGALLLSLFLFLGGLPDTALSSQAQERSVQQLETGELKHDLSYYSVQACGIGEVLARSGSTTTVSDILEAWQRSPGHAWVLAQDYDRVGVGIVRDPDGTTFWTVVLVRDC